MEICRLIMTSDKFESVKSSILASLEIEKGSEGGLRFKDFIRDNSTTQSARRIRTGMIILSIAYLQG